MDHSTLNELPRLLNLATSRPARVARTPLHRRRHADTVDLLDAVGCSSAGSGRARARAAAGAARRAGRALPARRATERLRAAGGEVPRLSRRRPRRHRQDRRRSRTTTSGCARSSSSDHIHRIIVDTDATSSGDDARDRARSRTPPACRSACCRRMLGAVGGSVVFDDIGGLMLMGVPRFGLSRSSLVLKRIFDLVGAGVGLIVAAPADGADRGRDQARLARAGAVPPDAHGAQRGAVRDAQVPQHGRRRRRAQGFAAPRTTRRDGLFKIDADPRITRVGRVPAPHRPRRAAAALQRARGQHEPGRPAAARRSTRTATSPASIAAACTSRPASPVAGRRSARRACRCRRWSRSTTSTSPTGRRGSTSRSSSRRSGTLRGDVANDGAGCSGLSSSPGPRRRR